MYVNDCSLCSPHTYGEGILLEDFEILFSRDRLLVTISIDQEFF